MNNGLIVSVSPHYHKQGATTQRVMRDVLIALIPALIASVIIFGFRSLLFVEVSDANCMLLEFVWNKLFKKEQTIADLSAVVTGVLIAYNVPVTMPIWQLLIGDFIAVIIVKMLFGGLGCNFVNPALVGRLAGVAECAAYRAYDLVYVEWNPAPVALAYIAEHLHRLR